MSKKLKLFLQELFIILASIIGIGFATGKEIQHFFCHNYSLSFIAVAIFLLCFGLFFSTCSKFVTKHRISNYKEFNKTLFGDYQKFINVALIIVYAICCSSMLAGIDTIARERFNFNLPLFSLILSLIVYIVLLGGRSRIENLFLKFVPILLTIIFLNLIVNSVALSGAVENWKEVFRFSTSNFKNILFALFLPLLFFGANFVVAMDSIITVKSNKNLMKWIAISIFAILISLAVVVIALHNNFESMPFLSLSKNLSNLFYFLYLFAILLSLVSTSIISSYNIIQLTKSKSKFSILIVVLANQILSFLGFEFIVKYLYTFSGILGLIYCVIVYIRMTSKNRQNKIKKIKSN